MKKTFIIATMGERVEGAICLLSSLQRYLEKDWYAVVVAQAYAENDLHKIQTTIKEHGCIIRLDDLIGPHSAKVAALNAVQSDIWCSLDDDMVAIEKTNFDGMADVALNYRNIGFLSGNWGRTATLALQKNRTEKLVPQNLVFTGGGMVFRDDIAEIIKNIPNEQYLFDDCLWAMYAYINGYSNYRFLDSVAVHKICTVGGRKTWLKQTNNRVLPPSEFINMRKCNDLDGYYICNDKDLTPLAHCMHRRNRK